jgi:hypothetical protein
MSDALKYRLDRAIESSLFNIRDTAGLLLLPSTNRDLQFSLLFSEYEHLASLLELRIKTKPKPMTEKI